MFHPVLQSANARGEGAELFDIVLRMEASGHSLKNFKNCVEISNRCQKPRCCPLNGFLPSKLAANRAKDKLTIPVLRDHPGPRTQSLKRRAKKNVGPHHFSPPQARHALRRPPRTHAAAGVLDWRGLPPLFSVTKYFNRT